MVLYLVQNAVMFSPCSLMIHCRTFFPIVKSLCLQTSETSHVSNCNFCITALRKHNYVEGGLLLHSIFWEFRETCNSLILKPHKHFPAQGIYILFVWPLYALSDATLLVYNTVLCSVYYSKCSPLTLPQEMNQYLDTLTEHFDIPKVSWTK